MALWLPLIFALGYAIVSMRFSVWRTQKMLDAQSHPLRDPKLEALTARMAQALDIPQIKVHIFDIEPVNGLAAPDGRIFLTTGFMKKYGQGLVTEEELASVIAHELGHVSMGHAKRRMIDVTGQNAVFMLLTTFLARFVPLIGPWVAQMVSRTLMAHLSRRDEFEADAYASALLIKSGIGTAPQKSLFRKLNALTQNRADGIPAWLMSHPKAEERIGAIEANEARWLGQQRISR
ncbi:M48 family metallopeptidase [Xinfangfangia sp. CPCC 101601]|uniref:M48 family metallopeptidase n=1 Tax=Pseudogemmobacter lacusdianii TaxID=3069608 RepID=A0ABU0VWT9_9RHOB|nr:M48 family metallopeptidase [Xinfangfangia sp. CPCC 101601]MDQ2065650.1 M48 family metallopeptidase [Xinfangfangia sp. CPCC 101601]